MSLYSIIPFPAISQKLSTTTVESGTLHVYKHTSSFNFMHISHLPHNGWGTRLTLAATSHMSQQFATLAQGSC